MQATLAEVELSLLRLPADEAPDDAIEVARALSDGELREWTGLSDRLLARPSFMERLSPSRWIASWRRRQLFKQEGLTDAPAFGEALHREKGLRPIRARLIEAVSDIGEPSGHLPPLRVAGLLEAARGALAQLSDAEMLVTRLEADRKSAV